MGDNQIIGDDIFNDRSSSQHIGGKGVKVISGGPEKIYEILTYILREGGEPAAADFMKWLVKEGLQGVKTAMICSKHRDVDPRKDRAKFLKVTKKEHDAYVKIAEKMLKLLEKELGHKKAKGGVNVDNITTVVVASLLMEIGILNTFQDLREETKREAEAFGKGIKCKREMREEEEKKENNIVNTSRY